jgi:hypothetical protein
MLREKSTSFKRQPDGSWRRVTKTVFKNEDTLTIDRSFVEEDEVVYVECDKDDDYSHAMDYFDFDGTPKKLFLKPAP